MHLWAESYERDVSEILDLQGKVATDIAHEVNIMVRPLEQTQVVNPQAYGLYLKGRYYFYQYTSRGWQQSIEQFRQAIDADPNFAPAYSGLADTYLVAGTYGALPPPRGAQSGQGGCPQGSRSRQQARERALRAGHRLHLVRLGLGECRERIPAGAGPEP